MAKVKSTLEIDAAVEANSKVRRPTPSYSAHKRLIEIFKKRVKNAISQIIIGGNLTFVYARLVENVHHDEKLEENNLQWIP